MISASGIVVTLAWAAIIAVLLRKVRFFSLPGLGPWHPWIAFAIKVLGASALWFIYTQYYGHRDSNDAFRYFDDALVIHGLWEENREFFWRFMLGYGMDDPALAAINEKLHCWTASYSYGLTHDGQTMIRLNVLLAFVSGGYYAVHTLILCFLSFTGLVALYRVFHQQLNCHPITLFIACFLLPSVVFWSSGVLKEAPLFFVFGFFILCVTRLIKAFSVSGLLLTLLLFVVLFYLKEYVIISFIPGLLFAFISQISGARRTLLVWILVLTGCFAVATQAGYFFSGGDFLYVLSKKQGAFISVAEMVDAGSLVYVPPVTDVLHYILYYPHALVLAYLRPAPWEANTLLMWAAAIENIGYAIMVLLTVWRFKRPASQHRVFLLMCLSFVLILGGIIGSVVPILGAVVRYRIVALPFLVVLCASCIRPWPALTTIFESWRYEKRIPAER